MKLLQSALIALTVFFGSISSAFAVGPTEVVDMIQGAIAETAQAIESDADKKEVLALIKKAKKLAKEINANDAAAAKTQRAVGSLKSASAAYKKGNTEKALVELKKAEERWEKVRGAF